MSERLGRYLDVVSWGMVFAYVFFHLMRELADRWAPGLTAEHAALTIGIPGVASLDAHYDLHTLARLLRADPTIATALAAHEPATAGAILLRDDGTAGRAFRRFLEQHGHRLTGRDLSCPTWSESPAMVVELALGAGPETALDRANVVRRRIEATERILAALGTGRGRRGPPGRLPTRPRLRPALLRAPREHALPRRFLPGAPAPGRARIRDGVGRTRPPRGGRRRLLARRRGARARDRRPDPARRAHRRAARRRACDAREPPTETLDAPPFGTAAPAAGVGGDVVDDVFVGEVGAPAAAAVPPASSAAPPISSASRPATSWSPSTPIPGWTSVLERAAGLVLEEGGVLSHGAIVARELGIPALVGVTGATRVLRDGEQVELDASAGTSSCAPGERGQYGLNAAAISLLKRSQVTSPSCR